MAEPQRPEASQSFIRLDLENNRVVTMLTIRGGSRQASLGYNQSKYMPLISLPNASLCILCWRPRCRVIA